MRKRAPKLQHIRARIDSVDATLLIALARRAKLVEEIGKYKKDNNISALDERRRNALKRKWIKKARSLRLPVKMITELFERIHDHSVSVEKNL